MSNLIQNKKKDYLCCANEYFQRSRNKSDGTDMEHS